MRKYLTIFFLIITYVNILSQSRSVRGYVFDFTDKKPLSYAHIVLTNIKISEFPHYRTTNDKGYFEFRLIQPGKYLLEITFLGYEKYIDTIEINWSGRNLDTIYLKQSTIQLKEIVVSETIPQVEQKGDTLEFNAAAFKTAPNSTLEDLVLKFPGVEKDDNNVIKVQGEEVQRVLVDGRRFFGDDPKIALRNLPAEIVEKVQLFDKKSDEAELTGFEDDQTVKAFNVITRVDKRKGYFGRFYGGYGSAERFNSGLNFNSFNLDERISLLGIANNINQSGFMTEDLSSSEDFSFRSRGGRGRGGRNQQNPLLNIPINAGAGNNNIYAGGINYSNIFNNQLEMNGSYFYNRVDNTNITGTFRKYLSEYSGLDRFNEQLNSSGKNQNHRFNIWLNYRIDSLNILRLQPNIQYSTNRTKTSSFAENYLLNQQLLNSNSFNRYNSVNDYDISNDMIYSHHFEKPGRIFTVSLNTGLSKRISKYDLYSLNISNSDSLQIIDSLLQNSNYVNSQKNLTIGISYSEPLTENSFIRLRINPYFMEEKQTRDTYENPNSSIQIFDSLNSNSFENRNTAFRSSISYRYNDDNLRIEADLMYQHHIREGKLIFPKKFLTRKKFDILLPDFEINYRFDEFKRLRIDFSTRAQIPSITQLQNTIDYSNPLFLKKGNPDLDRVLNNEFRVRFFSTNPEKGSFYAVNINLNYSINNISNNVIVFTRDTIIFNNYSISKGTQLSYPVNIGNAIRISTNLLTSFTIQFLKSNFSLSTDLRYSRTPSLINGKENTNYQYGIAETFSLSSYNPDFDYRINYSPNFTYSQNTLNGHISRILIHRLGTSFRINFLGDFYFGNSLNYYSNPNASDINQKHNILLNLSLAYRFLKNNNGEIRFEVIDVLNQRKKLTRIISEDYYEDRNTQQLERFIIFSVIYNLRSFN